MHSKNCDLVDALGQNGLEKQAVEKRSSRTVLLASRVTTITARADWDDKESWTLVTSSRWYGKSCETLVKQTWWKSYHTAAGWPLQHSLLHKARALYLPCIFEVELHRFNWVNSADNVRDEKLPACNCNWKWHWHWWEKLYNDKYEPTTM